MFLTIAESAVFGSADTTGESSNAVLWDHRNIPTLVADTPDIVRQKETHGGLHENEGCTERNESHPQKA